MAGAAAIGAHPVAAHGDEDAGVPGDKEAPEDGRAAGGVVGSSPSRAAHRSPAPTAVSHSSPIDKSALGDTTIRSDHPMEPPTMEQPPPLSETPTMGQPPPPLIETSLIETPATGQPPMEPQQKLLGPACCEDAADHEALLLRVLDRLDSVAHPADTPHKKHILPERYRQRLFSLLRAQHPWWPHPPRDTMRALGTIHRQTYFLSHAPHQQQPQQRPHHHRIRRLDPMNLSRRSLFSLPPRTVTPPPRPSNTPGMSSSSSHLQQARSLADADAIFPHFNKDDIVRPQPRRQTSTTPAAAAAPAATQPAHRPPAWSPSPFSPGSPSPSYRPVNRNIFSDQGSLFSQPLIAAGAPAASPAAPQSQPGSLPRAPLYHNNRHLRFDPFNLKKPAPLYARLVAAAAAEPRNLFNNPSASGSVSSDANNTPPPPSSASSAAPAHVPPALPRTSLPAMPSFTAPTSTSSITNVDSSLRKPTHTHGSPTHLRPVPASWESPKPPTRVSHTATLTEWDSPVLQSVPSKPTRPSLLNQFSQMPSDVDRDTQPDAVLTPGLVQTRKPSSMLLSFPPPPLPSHAIAAATTDLVAKQSTVTITTHGHEPSTPEKPSPSLQTETDVVGVCQTQNATDCVVESTKSVQRFSDSLHKLDGASTRVIDMRKDVSDMRHGILNMVCVDTTAMVSTDVDVVVSTAPVLTSVALDAEDIVKVDGGDGMRRMRGRVGHVTFADTSVDDDVVVDMKTTTKAATKVDDTVHMTASGIDGVLDSTTLGASPNRGNSNVKETKTLGQVSTLTPRSPHPRGKKRSTTTAGATRRRRRGGGGSRTRGYRVNDGDTSAASVSDTGVASGHGTHQRKSICRNGRRDTQGCDDDVGVSVAGRDDGDMDHGQHRRDVDSGDVKVKTVSTRSRRRGVHGDSIVDGDGESDVAGDSKRGVGHWRLQRSKPRGVSVHYGGGSDIDSDKTTCRTQGETVAFTAISTRMSVAVTGPGDGDTSPGVAVTGDRHVNPDGTGEAHRQRPQRQHQPRVDQLAGGDDVDSALASPRRSARIAATQHF